MRERYVQQKKQGDTGHMYEHLSRPYLEKMKFLDRYIQPRKSYRGIIPHLGNGSLDMGDSSKSNIMSLLPSANVICRLSEDYNQYERSIKKEEDSNHLMQHNYPSTSNHEHPSSVASPSVLSLISPPTQTTTETTNSNINSNSYDEPPNSDDDNNSEPQREEKMSPSFFTNGNDNGYPIPFPYPPNLNHSYNNIYRKQQNRSTDELLGELVTSELKKMSGEQKKMAQKKIIQILFFDD